LTHPQDAEDAFQATFLILACKAAQIRRRKLLASWLFGVARRTALKVRAVQARRARHELLCAEPPAVEAPFATPGEDLQAVLDEELARLPEKYRLPLLLCGPEGMTNVEAGKYLGWPTGTVAGRLWRGRALLRARLLRRGILVPAVALTAVLAPNAASAAVPPQLIETCIRSAAALVTAGKSAAAVVSPPVATLMRGVLIKMFFSHLWTTTAFMVVLAVTGGGAGMIWYLRTSAEPLFSASMDLAQGTIPPAAVQRPAPSMPAPKPPVRNTPAKPAIRLPADSYAVVFRMERSVNLSPGPKVVLTIYADGRIVGEHPEGLLSLSATDLTQNATSREVAEDRHGKPEAQATKVLQGRLSVQEIEELLRFALHDQEFFDFEEAAVKAAIRDKYDSDGNGSAANDATTTGFRIQTADQSHEVSWSRLDKAAWDFPKVERLLQLHALDRRLSQLFYVLVAGGPERVETVVAKMNELALPYYRLYPQVPKLTAADLFKVTPSADGSVVRFTFSRNKDKRVRNPLFEISLDVPRQGEPRLCYVMPPGNMDRGQLVNPAHDRPQ
jgi:DNA-directed RNA polymerase specialized sigma24 family protein